MLRIRNLKCYYGRIMAIKGVSLSVAKGRIITLIGAILLALVVWRVVRRIRQRVGARNLEGARLG